MDGTAGTCYHPVHEDLVSEGKDGAAFYYHPEHEADLSPYWSLTAIDSRELERCR
jgi:hypothetical protein